jgi:hypothetical protein
VNTILPEDILQETILIITLVFVPQIAQVEGGMLSTLQGTGRPLVFAVRNDTALEYV